MTKLYSIRFSPSSVVVAVALSSASVRVIVATSERHVGLCVP